MKLKNEFENLIVATESKRKIEYLKSKGYTEITEKSDKGKTRKRRVKSNEQEN